MRNKVYLNPSQYGVLLHTRVAAYHNVQAFPIPPVCQWLLGNIPFDLFCAVRFLSRLIEKNSSLHSSASTSNNNNNAASNGSSTKGIEKEQLELFKERLTVLLSERFQDHWFPGKISFTLKFYISNISFPWESCSPYALRWSGQLRWLSLKQSKPLLQLSSFLIISWELLLDLLQTGIYCIALSR